ncbi:MAG: hypothetical protein UR43_C0033G0009, partial [candidate division TM6 bacterium GW2011_GWF2_33_332]
MLLIHSYLKLKEEGLMPRTSRLPEYQAFIDAKDMLDKEPVDYVKYDKYVLV